MKDNITSRLRYCSSLPTIPGIAARLIDLASRPDANMAQISDCIAMDPALSAKFLKVARSPLYMTHRTATNVRQAISLLGTHASLMVALSFSLAPTIQDETTTDRLDLNWFWRRSLLAALTARALGEYMGYKKLDDLFLAGLLQDVGMLAFDTIMPVEYEKVHRATHNHQTLLEAERKTFGAGHDEVGYWLLKHWKLPDYLALSCLAYHNLSQESETQSRMTGCIAVSDYVADHLLDPENPQTCAMAIQSAYEHLEMNEKSLRAVLGRVAAQMDEVEDLFGLRLHDTAQADALMKEARDLQILRQLNKDAELERGALRDALTGAHNRSYLESVLQREFELATHNHWPLSMAMLDLDQFTNINTLYGYQVGDEVLVAIVRHIQGQIRPDDIFARAAGESFILLMPDVSCEHARGILLRLQESVAHLAHAPDRGTPFQVTVSIGSVTHMDTELQFDTPKTFLHAMENALEQAKSDGANQLRVWNQPKSA